MLTTISNRDLRSALQAFTPPPSYYQYGCQLGTEWLEWYQNTPAPFLRLNSTSPMYTNTKETNGRWRTVCPLKCLPDLKETSWVSLYLLSSEPELHKMSQSIQNEQGDGFWSTQVRCLEWKEEGRISTLPCMCCNPMACSLMVIKLVEKILMMILWQSIGWDFLHFRDFFLVDFKIHL